MVTREGPHISKGIKGATKEETLRLKGKVENFASLQPLQLEYHEFENSSKIL